MADLEGKTIAATYESILNVGTASNQNLDATPRIIEDGVGTNSALWLATGAVHLGVDDTGADFRVFSATTGEGLFYDASEDEFGLLLTTKLKFHDIGGGEEIFASANGHLEINAGTTLDITAPTVDLNSATEFNIDTVLYDLNASGATTFNGVPVTITSTGDITFDSTTDIVLDAGGGNFEFKDSGVNQLTIDVDGTAGGIAITLMVNGDDLIFNQYDETEVMRITDTARVGIGFDTPTTALYVRNNAADSASDAYALTLHNNHTAASAKVGIQALLSSLVAGWQIYSDSEVDSDLPYNMHINQAQGAGSTIFENAGTEMMRIGATGKVAIGGEDAPDSLLCINQGTDDTAIFTLKASEVAHGFTSDEIEADTYGAFKKSQATSGGLNIRGLKDADGDAGFAVNIQGYLGEASNTTHTTSAYGIVNIDSRITDGSDGTAAVTTNGNIFTVQNYGSTKFIVDAEGDVHSPTTNAHVAFADNYDDAQLIRAYDHAKDSYGLKGMVRQKWDEFVKYKEQDLIDIGVLYSPVREGGFTNVTQLQRLHNGAIWQQYTEMQKMKELMYDAMVELMGKDKADKKLDNYDIKLLDKDLLN